MHLWRLFLVANEHIPRTISEEEDKMIGTTASYVESSSCYLAKFCLLKVNFFHLQQAAHQALVRCILVTLKKPRTSCLMLKDMFLDLMRLIFKFFWVFSSKNHHKITFFGGLGVESGHHMPIVHRPQQGRYNNHMISLNRDGRLRLEVLLA